MKTILTWGNKHMKNFVNVPHRRELLECSPYLLLGGVFHRTALKDLSCAGPISLPLTARPVSRAAQTHLGWYLRVTRTGVGVTGVGCLCARAGSTVMGSVAGGGTVERKRRQDRCANSISTLLHWGSCPSPGRVWKRVVPVPAVTT